MASTFSSFDGLIAEIPGIAVDNFEHPDRYAYFLSHCHTDHTQGLSSSAMMRHLEDKDVSIYMSDVTAAIISGIPCYDGIKKYIKPLKLGSTTIKLPTIYGDIYIELTLIPASHCFGSVMFLFRTEYQTILFTGDFRMNINDISKFAQLHTKDGEPIAIDKMYVDTTFIDCDYDNFPKRTESIDYVLMIIKEWLSRDKDNAIALHPSARFGYEYVFNKIFKCLQEKVFVQDGDWMIYSKTDKVPGVTDRPTRIHKCRNKSENNNHQQSCSVSDTKNYLYIHLSALKWTNYESEHVPFERRSDKRVDVCFATHCSRSELINFISYFGATSVVGFPKPYVVVEEKSEKVVFKAVKRKLGGNGGRRKRDRVDV